MTRGMVLRGLGRRIARRSPYIYGGYLAYRGARAIFSRRNIGERIGTGTAKLNTTTRQLDRTIDAQELVQFNMTTVSQGQDISQRERALVNCRGFKICMEFRNNTDTPLYLNCAVISPKEQSVATDLNTDFFRNHLTTLNSNVRSLDFDTASLTAQDRHCFALNSDQFTILRHKRYRLGPVRSGMSYEAGNEKSYLNLNWYVPLKRQLRYNAVGTAALESGGCLFILWADQFDGTNVATNIANFKVNTQTYFRDPKN